MGNTMSDKDIIIGIDAGTSVIKAVAFDLHGAQFAAFGCTESLSHRAGRVSGSAAWPDLGRLRAALRGLADKAAGLARARLPFQ